MGGLFEFGSWSPACTTQRDIKILSQNQNRSEQNRKNQNRTSESWDRLGSDGIGEKGTTGDFKKESSGFMMVWMQEEWGVVCGAGGRDSTHASNSTLRN